MMHKSDFVLAIKDAKNQVLRELGGQVFLPFQSEYQILLKNLNHVRSCCTVTIDGTDVLGGQELIIDAHGTISLERFVVDGNLSSGQRFKFVPLSDAAVQDPSSAENGVIEVKFWREWTPPPQPVYMVSNGFDFKKSFAPPSDNILRTSNQVFPDSMTFTNCCADMEAVNNVSAAGATVAGSVSNQKFSSGYFGAKDGSPTVLRLKLVGQQVSVPLTVAATKNQHCTKCGRKAKFQDYFCGGCGTAL